MQPSGKMVLMSTTSPEFSFCGFQKQDFSSVELLGKTLKLGAWVSTQWSCKTDELVVASDSYNVAEAAYQVRVGLVFFLNRDFKRTSPTHRLVWTAGTRDNLLETISSRLHLEGDSQCFDSADGSNHLTAFLVSLLNFDRN